MAIFGFDQSLFPTAGQENDDSGNEIVEEMMTRMLTPTNFNFTVPCIQGLGAILQLIFA